VNSEATAGVLASCCDAALLLLVLVSCCFFALLVRGCVAKSVCASGCVDGRKYVDEELIKTLE